MKEITRQDYFERIASVLRYIEENCDRKVTLEELAEVACFSPYHFHRIFRSWVGESIAGYIRRLRVEQAAVALRYSSKRIFDIALDAGFHSPESFSRAFRKRFDLSPQQFRDAWQFQKVEFESTLEIVKHRLLYNKGNSMNTITIITAPTRKVAAVRHVGAYEKVGTAWETLCAWAGPKGLLTENTEYIGLSYDDPEITDADTIRYDATITLDRDVPSEGEIIVKEIPGGEFISLIHKGPFENLNQTYKQIYSDWLPGSGRELKNAPSLEKYLNDPDTTPPEDIRVEISIPLV